MRLKERNNHISTLNYKKTSPSRNVSGKSSKKLFPTINKCNTTPNALKIDKVQTTNKSRISEQFSRFFSSIATNLKKNAFKLKDFVWGYKADILV